MLTYGNTLKVLMVNYMKKNPDEMIYDGQPTTDTLSILEKLNHYFSTISERLQAEQPQNSPEFDSENLENYIKS